MTWSNKERLQEPHLRHTMPFSIRQLTLVLLLGITIVLLKESNEVVQHVAENDKLLTEEASSPIETNVRPLPQVETMSVSAKNDTKRIGPIPSMNDNASTTLTTSTPSVGPGDSVATASPQQAIDDTLVAGSDRLRFRTFLGVERENLWAGAQVSERVNLQSTIPRLHEKHYVMSKTGWDASPVVVEEYKLIFFTVPKVGCTVFKHLLRRLVGYNEMIPDPHNIEKNGLTLLSHYPIEKASEMLASDDWTKAIFVREPKDRILSAFLEKISAYDKGHSFIVRKCCPKSLVCERAMGQSFQSFLWMTSQCRDDHWNPQSWRMEGRHWAHINFVGHLETAAADTKTLLQRIGAWDKYGSTGWGKSGEDAIFASNSVIHHTGASDQLEKYYTVEIERLVEKLFEEDYQHPLFNFSASTKLALTDNATERILRSVWSVEQTYEMRYPLRDEVRSSKKSKLRLSRSDFVYRERDGGSPVVVEKFKLVFFPIPGVESTTFLKLCRRLMGHDNWNTTDSVLPHDPRSNGLLYLWNMTKDRAGQVLESEDWTKALFVREPKDRMLSVYLSRSPNEMSEYIRERCCPTKRLCPSNKLSFDEFVEIAALCRDPLWLPQSYRMEGQYWPYVNFIGHLERVQKDTRALLTRIGAWEEHGADGWGYNGTRSIFEDHSQACMEDMASVFYSNATENRVREIYAVDYEHVTLRLAAT